MAIRRFGKPISRASVQDRTYEGRTYDSKTERLYAEHLDELVKFGGLDYWTPQVNFRYTSDLSFRVDFLCFHKCEDEPTHWPYVLPDVWVVDVKGYNQTGWPLKRKRWLKYGPCRLLVIERKRDRWLTTEIIDPHYTMVAEKGRAKAKKLTDG